MKLGVWLVFSLLLTTSSILAKEETTILPSRLTTLYLTEQMQQAYVVWLQDLHEYEAWLKRLKQPVVDRRVRRFAKGHVRTRPDPPDWVGQYCNSLSEIDLFESEFCAPMKIWSGQGKAEQMLAESYEQEAMAKETPPKSRFKIYSHFDLLYRNASTGTSDTTIYGFGGMHLCVIEISQRLQLCPIGGLLMSLPSLKGGRRLAPATTYGASYLLKDFVMPGFDQKSSLYVNLSRAYVMSESPNPAVPTQTGTINMMGLSLTFMK